MNDGPKDQTTPFVASGLPGKADPFVPGGARRIPLAALLGTEREVLIIHNGEAYRLRVTANNKLILTK